MQKGNIGVTTEEHLPVIKKVSLSDHEIFLREMVSNAVDATQKLKTLAERGDFKGELGDLTVHVSLDADKGTLTISDRGIGMTEEEIDKYINQIAFSGVNDFLDKYKDNANAIIGHSVWDSTHRYNGEARRVGNCLQRLQGRCQGSEMELRRKSGLR